MSDFSDLSSWCQAKASVIIASMMGVSGKRFALFGWQCARALRQRGHIKASRALSLTPVNSVRYFEFDYARRSLPKALGACLDVSSPRLFSAYVYARRAFSRMVMLNPDSRDLSQSRKLITALQSEQDNVGFHEGYPGDLLERGHVYDCIWAISVIEHIPPPEDARTVQTLWRLLRPGGTLILTVPTDKPGWEEYRTDDPYGLTVQRNSSNEVFFQTFYDQENLQKRIIDPTEEQPAQMEWFGERSRGHFHRYIKRWRKRGVEVTLKDPLDIALHYRRFNSYDEMPGMGICGLTFQKNE